MVRTSHPCCVSPPRMWQHQKSKKEKDNLEKIQRQSPSYQKTHTTKWQLQRSGEVIEDGQAIGQDELEGHNFFIVPLSTTKKQLYSVFYELGKISLLCHTPKHDFWIELYPDLFVPHEFPMKWISFALNPPITRFMSKWNELTFFSTCGQKHNYRGEAIGFVEELIIWNGPMPLQWT